MRNEEMRKRGNQEMGMLFCQMRLQLISHLNRTETRDPNIEPLGTAVFTGVDIDTLPFKATL